MAWIGMLVGGVAVVLLGALSAAGAAREDQRRTRTVAPRIAVVDMAQVLKASDEWRDSAETRSRLLDSMKRTLNGLTRQVQVLRNEYENLPPGTEERERKGVETQGALDELQQTRLEFENRIAQHHNESARNIFRKLSRAVSAYAQEQGINLVLKKQDFELTG
ncbi:MAG: OmpH family outer membrane protein, partial [Planctomycetota bacterium]